MSTPPSPSAAAGDPFSLDALQHTAAKLGGCVHAGPVERAALAWAIDDVVDFLLDELATGGPPSDHLLQYLPRRYRASYDAAFVRNFTVCIIGVAQRLTGDQRPDSDWTATLGEDLAVRMLILRATHLWAEINEDTKLPPPYDKPPVYADLEQDLYWDLDFELLYDGGADGVDAIEQFGITSHDYTTWFTYAYGGHRPHPYLAGVPLNSR